MACERYFSHFTFRRKVASVRWFKIKKTSKSIIMDFSMRVSPMWPNAVPHLCGILLVLRHLASVLWMYHITINIHNIHPIDDGSMALHVIHNTEQQLLFLWTTLFATNVVQWARVYETLKWFMKVNPEVMYYYQYS
jgi:hypothetical protein